MNVYFAGTTVSKAEQNNPISNLFKNGCKLHSYFHCQEDGFEHKWWKLNMKNKVNLFLDSGAFSAFTQGIQIDIQEYIAFIKEHKQLLEVYANLDVIGDPEATWKNQMIMEDAGLNPLPCFHYREDPKWLIRMLKRGYEYIALGGMVPVSTANLLPWLDGLFSKYLCDENGMPKVKIHGFGLTSLRLMLRYPWYSVDSTSWVVTGRMGSVYVPKYRKGEYVYNQDSWKICVSTRNPSKVEKGKHIDTISNMERNTILNYFTEKGFELGESRFEERLERRGLRNNERWYGKANKQGKRQVEVIIEPGLCNDYKLRDQLNIIYFLDLEKRIPSWPWPFKSKRKKGLLF